MAKDLRISLDKTHALYGRLDGSLKKPLVIIVHGLPDSMYAGIHEEAARWFTAHGYAVFRLNLYSWQKDARRLIQCTLTTHAKDLDAVVDYFRKKGTEKVFVIGHSFGGPTVLLSKKQHMDAAVLWDASYNLSFTKKRYGMSGGKFIKSINGYLMPWGESAVLGKAMVEEVDNLLWDDLPKSLHVPIKFIAAGSGVLVPGNKRYFKNANDPKALTIIPRAQHHFDQSVEIRDRLFKETAEWFRGAK